MIILIRLAAFVLALFPAIAFGQTIAEKNFKEPGVPVFVANGFINFSAASTSQSNSFEGSTLPDAASKNPASNSRSVGNDTQVFLKAGVMSQSGVKSGAVGKFEMNYNSQNRSENPNLDQLFFYSESDFGRFEIGNNQPANQKMKTGPARLARGAGGINGKYLEHVSLPMLANSSQSSSPACLGGVGDSACSNVKLPRFILLAQSPIGHGGYAKSFYRRGANNSYASASSDYGAYDHSRFRALKDDSFEGFEDATKISYYSPRIEGFQVGASFTPNSQNQGITARTAKDLDYVRLQNIASFAANYSQSFDNVDVALSATGEKGQVKNSKSASGVSRSNLFAYDFGASVSYFGFSLAASYGSWGSSLQPENGIYSCDYDSSQNLASQNCGNGGKKFSNPSYYTLGLAYRFGPIATSLTSIRSEFQKNKYQAVSLDLDYKLTRDLMPYFEVTKFTFASNQPSASNLVNQGSIASNQRQLRDNSGYVFLTGILYSF